MGGQLNDAFVVDEIGIDAKLILVILQGTLETVDTHAYPHYTEKLPGAVPDLAVYKDSNGISGPFHLIVIHIHGIILIRTQQRIEVPEIFRIIRRQYPVQTIKIVIPRCGGGYKKDGIIAVFFLIGTQIFPDCPDKIRIIHTLLLLNEHIMKQAVIRHRQGDIHRFIECRTDLIINSFRCQIRHLLDVFQRRAEIGPVAENGGQQKSHHNN